MKRAVAFIPSIVITLLLFCVAFLLGTVIFKAKREARHAARLMRLLARGPTEAQVESVLQGVATPLPESPRDEAALRAAVAKWRGQKQAEILEKGKASTTTRILLAGDMVYFIYFDAHGIMSGFTYVST